jgi:hypothetical protein
MTEPRRLTPGGRARRALAIDAAAAVVLALLLLQLAAGLGVVAAVVVPLLLVGLLWIGVERLLVRIRHRRRRAG